MPGFRTNIDMNRLRPYLSWPVDFLQGFKMIKPEKNYLSQVVLR